jgi:Putative endonuclease, protein of unknown function (DUF1780)
MSHAIEQARRKYLPEGRIEILFIAEAPPANPARFFYFDKVDRNDWLYLGLTRVLFTDARDLDVKQLREQKLDYLERFRARGYYLIDASDRPMPAGATVATKRAQLQASLDQLVGKVRSLVTSSTRVVLISKSAHEVCCARLTAEGFNVVNTEMIDFPSTGRQQHFARKLRRDLQASDEFLQSTIRGLEASLEFFGIGDAKKRERERWIVERFLRGLGLQVSPDEIEQPYADPPDARFRDAAFEVKEILETGRRRGDEYGQALKRAKAAISYDELSEGFTPQSLPIADAYRLVMEQTRELSAGKYVNATDRRGLDLLFYMNLDMALAWDIEDGTPPDIAPLVAEGWRSVSFLHGTSTICVLHASDASPDFLKSAQDKLISLGLTE